MCCVSLCMWVFLFIIFLLQKLLDTNYLPSDAFDTRLVSTREVRKKVKAPWRRLSTRLSTEKMKLDKSNGEISFRNL